MATTKAARVHDLARVMADSFERRERDNGDPFVVVTDDAPAWVSNVCYTAHGDMGPNDYRYLMIESAAEYIANLADDDCIGVAEEDFADREPSPDNAARSHWLASDLRRAFYVDDAVENMGWPGDLYTALAWGWYEEAREVFGLVLGALDALAGEDAESEGGA